MSVALSVTETSVTLSVTDTDVCHTVCAHRRLSHCLCTQTSTSCNMLCRTGGLRVDLHDSFDCLLCKSRISFFNCLFIFPSLSNSCSKNLILQQKYKQIQPVFYFCTADYLTTILNLRIRVQILVSLLKKFSLTLFDLSCNNDFLAKYAFVDEQILHSNCSMVSQRGWGGEGLETCQTLM